MEPGEGPERMWCELERAARQSQRPGPALAAHLWALNIVRDVLGDDWPEHHLATNGHLPNLLPLAAVHPVAFQELLELATRAQSLRTLPGFARLRRDVTRDVAPRRMVHTLLQLELGDLGALSGLRVAFEHGAASPADVTVGAITFEVAVVSSDLGFRDDREYSDRISAALWQLRATYRVDIDGHLGQRLDPESTTEWLMDLDAACQQAVVSGQSVKVTTPDGSVTVHPPTRQGPCRFEGPPMLGAGWERTARRLREKDVQARRSGARWLRVDLRDGTFGFSPWYQQPFGQRADTLAATVRVTMDETAFDGVAVSSGALCAFQGLDTGTFVHPDGQTARSYWIGPARARELYVVPLTARGREDAPAVESLYELEPTALDRHLTAAGHAPVRTLLA